jgi:hypothetical protein
MILDAKSISGNSDVLGIVLAIVNTSAVKHHIKEISPPTINEYSVTGAITNYRLAQVKVGMMNSITWDSESETLAHIVCWVALPGVIEKTLSLRMIVFLQIRVVHLADQRHEELVANWTQGSTVADGIQLENSKLI